MWGCPRSGSDSDGVFDAGMPSVSGCPRAVLSAQSESLILTFSVLCLLCEVFLILKATKIFCLVFLILL